MVSTPGVERVLKQDTLPHVVSFHPGHSLLRRGLLHIRSHLGEKNSRGALRLGKGKIKARGKHLLTGASAEERAPARRINGYGNGNHNARNNLAMHFMLQTPELSLMRHLARE